MSKKATGRRSSTRQSTPQNQQVNCIKTTVTRGVIAFILFLLITALLAAFMLKSDSPPKSMRIMINIVFGCASFLSGFLCTAHKREPILPNCFFAGFTYLLLVLFCGLIAAKAQFTVLVCIPIALGLICPILGGLVGKKIK